MRSATLSRVDERRLSDIHLRLDVLEQRGQYFRNPVTVFTAVNGPANFGVKASFQVYLTKGVDSVEILRNTARDFGSAAVLQTYALSTLTVNKPITYYDHDKAIIGKTAYYWVRVIPKPGKFQPIVQGPQIVTVPPTGDSSITAPNDPTNITNGATVDSIDAGSSATVRVYGAAGGVGTNWTRNTGYGGTPSFAPVSLLGLAYTTKYYVMWTGPLPITPGASYQAFTSLPNALPDSYTFVGVVTTVAAGGGGGSSGGGGASRGTGGCCEIGTRIEIPPASRLFVRKEDCDEWVELETEDRHFVAVARNTLVSTFIRAQDLQPGTLLETPNGGLTKLARIEEKKRKSIKLVARVLPGHVYFGGGLRLHNVKLL